VDRKLVCNAVFSGNLQPAIGVRLSGGPVMQRPSRAQRQVSQDFEDDRTRMD